MGLDIEEDEDLLDAEKVYKCILHIHIYIFLCIYMCIYKYIHIYIFIYLCIHIFVCMNLYSYFNINIQAAVLAQNGNLLVKIRRGKLLNDSQLDLMVNHYEGQQLLGGVEMCMYMYISSPSSLSSLPSLS
jgi:hypothetical protein